ncbi:MAG: GNAT family N-acetyltransferase, partial [Natronohydrobacter sp.]|nr:GNAT family N-acetyltransferase [Natronohydrobacter sp.]
MSDTTLLIRPVTAVDDDRLWAMLEPVFRAGDTYALDPAINRAEALAWWRGGTHRAFMLEDGGWALGTYYICPNQQGGGAHV